MAPNSAVTTAPEQTEVAQPLRRTTHPRRVSRIEPPTSIRGRLPRLAAGRERWERRYARQLMLLDAALAGVAAVLALLVRFGDTSEGGKLLYLVVTAVFPLVWLASLALGRAYDPRFIGSGGEEYRRVFDSAVRLLAAVALIAVAAQFAVARGFIVVIFPLATLFTLLGRYVARRALSRARQDGYCKSKVLLVGRERSVSDLLKRLSRGEAYQAVGACVDRHTTDDVDGVPIVGGSHEVLDALTRTGADTVAIAAWSDLSQEDLRHLSWRLEGTGVDLLVTPSLTDIAGPRVKIRAEAGIPLLHIDEPRFDGPQRAVKALLDRSLAGAALVVASPLLLVLAVAVRLDSRGPAFFRQTRVGTDGTTFTMVKFRSMHRDAEARLAELTSRNENADGLLFKMRDDPRITRVGKHLRRFSLDELPQLFNVLGGTMSLVGPRPPLPTEVDRYGHDVRRRLLVKPGLTGLWQISGRSDLSWDESVRLDLDYVENWSPAMDFLIIWRTLGVVLSRSGAY